ncbi:hypothetical protein [Pedobacter aquae]|nr:hypothetical protein [Pedobacter aquae]
MTKAKRLKKMKVIQKEVKKFEDRLFHHSVDLMLDETPTLKKFLDRNKDLSFSLIEDDFNTCHQVFTKAIYQLFMFTEEINQLLIELIEKEDDDLPF